MSFNNTTTHEKQYSTSGTIRIIKKRIITTLTSSVNPRADINADGMAAGSVIKTDVMKQKTATKAASKYVLVDAEQYFLCC